ncbi:cuticle protein 7-like [Daphnia pulicaria]|uniref:cuticle protein 7-like n=1 Tax=Daphnia pulicaria TaxID=35523 RepID=UPI001EEA145F|nr:cuticle protein 7-like [Daphnia pulicaria]
MKSTIACLLVLAVAAQAQYFGYGAVPAAVPAAAYPVAYGYPSFSATQYHAQDELGQASFGYAHPGQAATNLRDGFGNQVGSYAYFNPEGKEVRVSYTADSRGFRVLSNNLPVAPVDNSVAPVQVQDTPEVAKAKADHMAAVAAAKATPVRARRQAHPFPAHVGVDQIGGAHPGPAHVGAGQIGGAHPGPAHVGAGQRGGAHPCPAFVAC